MLDSIKMKNGEQGLRAAISSMINHDTRLASLLVRYVIAGFSVGMVYVFLGHVFSAWVGLAMPVSVTLAYIATTPLAFALQKRFTFKSDCALSTELPRFAAVAVLLLAMSSAAHEFAILPVPATLQLFIFWLLGSVLNFIAYKFWVFSRQA